MCGQLTHCLQSPLTRLLSPHSNCCLHKPTFVTCRLLSLHSVCCHHVLAVVTTCCCCLCVSTVVSACRLLYLRVDCCLRVSTVASTCLLLSPRIDCCICVLTVFFACRLLSPRVDCCLPVCRQDGSDVDNNTIEELQAALASGQALLQTDGSGGDTLQMVEGQCVVTG